jgi:hypothetical protein
MRLLNPSQELPRVCRKAFDVTPLTFGEQSVQSKRRFAAAAYPANHRQTVQRDVYIQIAQIVFGSAAEFYPTW